MVALDSYKQAQRLLSGGRRLRPVRNSRRDGSPRWRRRQRRMRRFSMLGSQRAATLVRRSIVLGCAATLLVIGVQSAGAAQPASWLFGGNDIANSRTQSAETKISSANVGQLAVKWTAPTHGDVSATPTVANGVVLLPRLGWLHQRRERSDGSGDLAEAALRGLRISGLRAVLQQLDLAH